MLPDSLRQLITATKEMIYMNTGWAGPSPEPVLARMQEVATIESRSGPASLEGLALSRKVNEDALQAAAALFRCEMDEVLLTHGTTEGVHIVLHGWPWQAGDELVTCDLEHPAILSPASVLEERRGVIVKRVNIEPNASAGEMIESIAAALSPKTKIVALSHVQYSCGLRMPVREIAAATHAADALLLIDGAQTGGCLDLDMRELDADFYAISGQKWLLGPQGTGAFYIRGDLLRRIDPLFSTHDLADARAQAAEMAGVRAIDRFRITSHNTPLKAGFAEAANLLLDCGMRQVEEHGMRLAARLKAGAAQLTGCAFTCPTDPVSSPLVSIAVEGWPPRQAVEQLWERWRIAGRVVNHPEAVRFSTAAFNTEDEVDRVLAALGQLATEEPPVIEAAAHA